MRHSSRYLRTLIMLGVLSLIALVTLSSQPIQAISLAATDTLTPSLTWTPTLAPTLDSTSVAANMTAVARLATTTRQPRNVSGPGATAIALVQGALRIGGPRSGVLKDNQDGVMAADTIGSAVYNFVAEARFFNVSTRKGLIGFEYFTSTTGSFYQVTVDYFRNWSFTIDDKSIAMGVAKSFDNTKAGFNDLQIVFLEKNGYFYINGDLVGTFKFAMKRPKGRVSVLAGTYINQPVSGQETYYRNFSVWQLP
jgi:hypothetical protein